MYFFPSGVLCVQCVDVFWADDRCVCRVSASDHRLPFMSPVRLRVVLPPAPQGFGVPGVAEATPASTATGVVENQQVLTAGVGQRGPRSQLGIRSLLTPAIPSLNQAPLLTHLLLPRSGPEGRLV